MDFHGRKTTTKFVRSTAAGGDGLFGLFPAGSPDTRSRITNPGTYAGIVESFLESGMPPGDSDFQSYLEFIESVVIPESMNTYSPAFIGHMTSALPAFMTELAKVGVSINQNMVKLETSKILTAIERQCLGKLHRLIYGSPEAFYREHIQNKASTLGIMVSGGTISNITALWCARKGLGSHAGKTVIMGSELMHYSFVKAADLLGIGEENLIRIPVDRKYRMDTVCLARQIRARQEEGVRIAAVVGTAGTTECGSIDPLEEIGAICRSAGIHFHVDAAWGGPMLFNEAIRPLFSGLESADTVTMDGHKQLYLPMGIGMLFFKDPRMAAVIEKQANYIIREDSYDLGRRSLEGSRPAMCLYLDAALTVIGGQGYARLMEQGIRNARLMASEIAASESFQLLVDPVLNILLYRFIPFRFREAVREGRLDAEANEEINIENVRLQSVQSERGSTFISRTRLSLFHGTARLETVALRAVLANPLTGPDEIISILSEQEEIGNAPAPERTD